MGLTISSKIVKRIRKRLKWKIQVSRQKRSAYSSGTGDTAVKP